MALTNSQRQAQYKRRKKEGGGLNLNIFIDSVTVDELDNIAARYQVTKQDAVKMAITAMSNNSLPSNDAGQTNQPITDNDLQAIFQEQKNILEQWKAELSATNKLKVDKLIEKQVTHMRSWYKYEIDKEAKAKLPEMVAELEAESAKARATEKKYLELIKHFYTIMTFEEFKIVRSALHPDRASNDADRAKLNKAFQIFNRLEKQVDKTVPIARLREYGWEEKSPFYKAKGGNK